MAKGLPYFKFTPTEWLTGDIVYEPYEIQGLFINICALYWQRDGELKVEEIEKRYKQANAIQSLIDRFIIVKDGYISIAFLDEQFVERNHKSQVNKVSGSKGGKAKVANAKRTLTERVANKKKNKNKEEEQKEEVPTYSVFLDYAKTQKPNVCEQSLKLKYDSWVVNGWKSGNDKKIKNWKSTLNNTLPYIKESEVKPVYTGLSIADQIEKMRNA